MLNRRRNLSPLARLASRGDTLIEVLFAVATFSLVVVTSLSIMNQGTSASIRSLQITLVRQEIDSQADTLRFLSSSYVAAYSKGYAPSDATPSPAQQYYKTITSLSAASVSKFGGDDATKCPTAPDNSFIFNTRTSQYVAYSPAIMQPADTFSQTVYDTSGASPVLKQSQGLWIEAAVPAAATNPKYIDFHIRACWYPPGSGLPMNLGTIVRLYEPTN